MTFRLFLSESSKWFDADSPRVSGTDVICPGKTTLIDRNRHTIQTVHIGERLTYIHICKTTGKQNNVPVNSAGIIFNGDANTITILNTGFQK